MYKITEKGRTIRSVLEWHTANIEPDELTELESKGVTEGYLISTGIYQKDGEGMIASGPNQDIAEVIAEFYGRAADTLYFEDFKADIEGVTQDYMDRAVWAGLVEEVLD